MTPTPEQYRNPQPAAVRRGEDDRRSTVHPSDNPAPRSPQADAEAVRKGQETLERVTTK